MSPSRHTSFSPLMYAALATLALQPSASRAAEPAGVTITITDTGCLPSSLSLPSGRTTFSIKNASRRAVEFEILSGVMVMDERENIIPGLMQKLTTTLAPGSYQLTCGLLSNPKGMLTVTSATAVSGDEAETDFSREITQYRAYVAGEIEALVAKTRLLVDAVRAGNLAEAQRAYAPAHLHYERIEPVAELFNDLDSSMDSRADDFERKEADTSFVGFHRLEKALFADHTTEGMTNVAGRLMTDALDLQKRIARLAITPKVMVGGAADLIEEVASKKISGEEDRYSRTDLWDFQANVDGAKFIYGLLKPQIEAADKPLAARTETNFARVDGILARYRTADGGFASYDALSARDRLALRGPVTMLAEDLSKLRGTLGVD